ncbi:MAG: 3-hydroxyacyl-CoA dehydrogenase NAD-binding domain-containing protein, partial [Calditrichia bacterium]
MDIKNIMVIGSGTMGNGIAHVFALHEYNVILMDIREEYCERGLETIKNNLQRQVKKETISEEKAKQTLARIQTSITLEDCREADLVIEAATEDLKVKKDIFTTVDKICGPDTIIASNTSSISITTLAAATGRPDKFVGMHFMNPVPVMKLVEIIRGLATSDKTATAVFDIAKTLEKAPVEVNDYPGFISNRILM